MLKIFLKHAIVDESKTFWGGFVGCFAVTGNLLFSKFTHIFTVVNWTFVIHAIFGLFSYTISGFLLVLVKDFYYHKIKRFLYGKKQKQKTEREEEAKKDEAA
jgi:hypothetical protein